MKHGYQKLILFFCLLLAVFYAWPQCHKIAYRIVFNFKRLVLLKGDYERLHEISPLYCSIKEIKDAIPPHAAIALSAPSTQFGIKYLVITYWLYPRVISDDWSYFIDLDHTINPPFPSNLEIMQLPSGVHIFAKKGHPWRSSTQNDHGKLLSSNLLLFIILSLWLVVIGSLVLKSFSLRPIKPITSWFYSSAYLIGLLAFFIPLWGLLMLGEPFDQPHVYGLMIFISIMALICYKLLRGFNPALEPPIPVQEPLQFMDHCANALSVFLVLLFLGVIISIPISVWDEVCIWIIKARMFCFHHGLDFSYTSPTNNYYPILWPLNNAFYFLLIGDHDEIAKWVSAITFLCFLVQFKACLHFLGIKQKLLWPLTVLYLMLFYFWTYLTALPENIFMAFLMAMASGMIVWLKDPLHAKKYLALALVMAVGLTLVKFEGAIAVCLGGASLILADKGLALRKSDYGYGAFFLMFLLIPWAWSHWVQSQGIQVTCYHLQAHFSVGNIGIIAKLVARFLVETKLIVLIVAAALSVAVLGPQGPWSKPEKFLLLWSLGLILFSMAAGLCWPSEDLQKYYPEAFARLFIRALPGLMLVWATRFYAKGSSLIPPHTQQSN